MFFQGLLQMQYSKGLSSEETRGESTWWSNDADCNVRGGASSLGSTRDAGERGHWGGFGIRVNVSERNWNILKFI